MTATSTLLNISDKAVFVTKAGSSRTVAARSHTFTCPFPHFCRVGNPSDDHYVTELLQQ